MAGIAWRACVDTDGRRTRLAKAMTSMKNPGRFATAFVLALTVIVAAEPGRTGEIRLDALNIPITVSGPGGSHSVELEAIVVRPDDGLAHPLAVLNHGSPRNPDDRSRMTPYSWWAQAVAFARRGWVAVAFMRRGYGHSQGEWAENYGPCSNPDYATAGRAGASDIAAIAKFMTAQSYVSKGKWISVGHSAGGFATVALTADPPHDLAAAIGFAPGRGSTAPDTVCGESQLSSAFAQYGKTSRVPLLWVAAENDHFFGPRLVPLLSGAFSRAGGNVTLVKAPAFGSDGHQLFTTVGGIPIWSPIVDRFLASNNLVLRDHLIEVAIPNVAAPAGLGTSGIEAFKAYLESGPNKAFAIASNSRFGWVTGRRTIEEARADALGYCLSGKSAKCWIVNLNNKPVE
jgi:dienelactone hydrolase